MAVAAVDCEAAVPVTDVTAAVVVPLLVTSTVELAPEVDALLVAVDELDEHAMEEGRPVTPKVSHILMA